jgi:tetratricopeptide (TPR) repeat protein
MVAIPEQGRLEEHPLPRLLLELYRARFGGALTLSRDRVGKRFLFREGVPVFAESNLASESLGVQLMDAGKIARADYNRVVAHIEAEGCKEGKALLDLDLIDPKGLFQALKDQVRFRILECFGWPRGEFFVDPELVPPPDAQPFRTDVYALIQDGIETHWAPDRVLAELQPEMNRYPRRSPRFAGIAARLRGDESVEALVEAVDGTRTLWKVVQAARTPRALAAAWLLHAGGALGYRDAPAPSGDPSTTHRDIDIVVERSSARSDPSTSGGPVREARKPSALAERLRAEIGDKASRLGELDAYQLLGVQRGADALAVKRAYHEAAKLYHPDALARAGIDSETLQQANRVFAAIGKAHSMLSDPERRREYDEALQDDATEVDANRLANAETMYRKGEILLRQGNFRGALDYLRAAVDLWPDEAAYQSALGWSLFKKGPSEPDLAREHLERAAALDDGDAVTYSRLSVVLRALGESEAADAAQARSQRLDPGS